MKFRIREVYGSSEKNGKTKCELQMLDRWKAEAIAETIREILRESNPKYIKYPLPQALYIPKSFVGWAKLAQGDTYDRSTGRKVARDKAYEKYIKWAKKFETYVKMYTKEISETLVVKVREKK